MEKKIKPKWTGVFQVNHFDCISDLLAAANASQKIRYHNESKGGVRQYEYVGRRFISWEDCFRKAHESWKDGIDTILKMIERVEHGITLPKPKSIRRRPVWSDDDGDEVSLDRLRNGDSYWRKMQRREVTGSQTVSVFCTVNAPKNYDSNSLFWRGVTSVVLTHLLEKAGYRVELYGVRYVMDSYKNHDSVFMSCCLKRAGQPLDIASIVNAISGWFYRTVWLQAQYSIRPKEVNDFMGVSLILSDENKYVKELAGKHESIVIDGVYCASEIIPTIQDAINKIDKVEKPVETLIPDSSSSEESDVGIGKKKRRKKAKITYQGDS